MFDSIGKDTIYNHAGVLVGSYFAGLTSKYHTWYLEYPDGDIDTLVGYNNFVRTKEGRLEDCYCNNPLTYVGFNGKEVRKHESLRPFNKPVYILEK